MGDPTWAITAAHLEREPVCSIVQSSATWVVNKIYTKPPENQNCFVIEGQCEFSHWDSMRYDNEPQCMKTYLLTCAPNEYSNEPAHPYSLIRVFVVRVKKRSILGYPICDLWRFRSDCANTQADLNLHKAYISEVTFLGVAAETIGAFQTMNFFRSQYFDNTERVKSLKNWIIWFAELQYQASTASYLRWCNVVLMRRCINVMTIRRC